MKTVLCVEDELKILENNRKAIEDAGYTVLTAANLKQAREHLARQTPGAIILDIILPDGNGLDLLKELRGAGSKIPVLMLTAWGKPSDIARGLKLGANDYISKPFEYEVLLARLETMFRNLEQVPETIIKGPVTLEVFSNKAYLGGENLALTQKDFDLLFLLVQNEDK
ncbi:MAG: response regulator transcription factor, partial [Oscillospiraceae bacterium]|nr:response regulator transcription factor [Oscillospiraceae bacterium]